MGNRKLILFFLLGCALTFVKSAQNLCNDAKAKGQTHAADPSDCTRYLYCERDPAIADDTKNIVAVHYLQCDQSTQHKYFKDGLCVTSNSHCLEPLDLCPPSGAGDIKIANSEEATLCNEFRFCKLPGVPMTKCSATSAPGTPDLTFQFDRNTGTCVDNSNAAKPFLPNCLTGGGSGGGDLCEAQAVDFVGYIAGAECDDWIYCYQQKTHESGVCPCGQIFDTANPPCVVSTTDPGVQCRDTTLTC